MAKNLIIAALLVTAALISGCGSGPSSAAADKAVAFLRMAEKSDNGAFLDEEAFFAYFNQESQKSLGEGMSWYQRLTQRSAQLRQTGISVTYDISDIRSQEVQAKDPKYVGYHVTMRVDSKLSDGTVNKGLYSFVMGAPKDSDDFRIFEIIARPVN